MATSKEELQGSVDMLNKAAGFGAGPRLTGTEAKGFKRVGKGFKIDYAYGNVALVYVNYTQGTGQNSVSERMTKGQLLSAIRMAIKVLYSKKR